MKVLLDTHIILWGYFEPERMSEKTIALLRPDSTRKVFSTVNLWEIAIKRALSRKSFQVDPRMIRARMLNDGFEELPVLGPHAVHVDTLPLIHKDPFDRILIAQAMVEGIILLTSDPVVAQYPGPIRRV